MSSPLESLSRIHALARIGIGLTWIYHGLVPKLLFRDWSEMTLLREMGVEIQYIPALLMNIGYAEVALGLMVMALWRSTWPFWPTIGIMLSGLVSVARHSPATLHAAFNPVSLNGLLVVLAVIALFSQPPPKQTGS